MRIVAFLVLVIIVTSGIIFANRSNIRNTSPQDSTSQNTSTQTTPNSEDSKTPKSNDPEVVARDLDTPWGIVFLPDRSILVTERRGTVRIVDSEGRLLGPAIATLSSVRESGEGGLLGIDIHPDFANNNFVYLYYTYSSSGNNTLNRVVRMTLKDGRLTDEQTIVDAIPGASNHNGGRIKFGPDKFLYIGTGDAGEPSRAQDRSSLAGKILRVTDTGAQAPGNPFGSAVYSYGHRNVQGLAWDESGNLWATEHGRSGVQSGFDEINLIASGKNYGWPDSEGDKVANGTQKPARHSGASTTWAPSGAAFVNNSLFFGGLRGQTLYEAAIQGDLVNVREFFNGEFGRIRDVVVGPDNMIYFTTSNKDGRGSPKAGDDKILRFPPSTQ